MHLQREPWAECKLVRCTHGAIFDVVLDLRPNSATYCQWVGAELTSENHKAFYIPEGCAHGFQTLTETSEVLYQMSQYFAADSAAGVRWNDPVFSIQWPETDVRHLSPRDAGYPDFHDVRWS
jgi:dTDP-4-dehydrorhamnose 3,5-epimerase